MPKGQQHWLQFNKGQWRKPERKHGKQGNKHEENKELKYLRND